MIRQSDSKQQQRVIIAVALSFLFFIVYSEFFMKPQFEQNATVNATTADNISQNVQNAAPKLNTATQNQALNTQVAAPSSSTQGTQNIIAKIKSEHFEASIDHLGRISSFKLLDAKYKDENSKFVEVIPSKAYT
ncbi:membrane protein insertase YidC, partial [Campylobacter avium]